MKFYFSTLLNRLIIFAVFSISILIACNNQGGSPGDSQPGDSLKTSISKNFSDSAKAYADLLKARVQKRIDYFNSEFEQKMLAPELKNIPIDTPIARIYMQSFHHMLDSLNDPSNTKAVVITRKQLAFYLNYLDTTGERAIMMAIGRYDRPRLSRERVVDWELDTRMPDHNNRLTLIVGLPGYPLPTANRSNFIRPFKSEGKVFYDDWQGLWP